MPSTKLIIVCILFAFCYYTTVVLYTNVNPEAAIDAGITNNNKTSDTGTSANEISQQPPALEPIGKYWDQIVLEGRGYPENFKERAKQEGGIIGYINRQEEGGRIYVEGNGEVWVFKQGDNLFYPNYFLAEQDLENIEKDEKAKNVDRIYVYIPPTEKNKNAILHAREEVAVPSSEYLAEKYGRGETDQFAQALQNIFANLKEIKATLIYDFGISAAIGLPERLSLGKIIALIWSSILVIEIWQIIPNPAGGEIASLIGMGLKYGIGIAFLAFIGL